MRNLLAGLVLLLTAKAAWATYHIMKIVEVFPGTMAEPNAQYVKLQMYAIDQNFVSGHSVVVYDASGAAVGTYTFASMVPNGADQSVILIATTEAHTLFSVTPDLTMTPTIARAGGMVCFDAIDCVAWGTFNGTAPSPVGRPAYQAKGLIVGRSLTRNLKGNASLEAADDTNVSADDFQWATPTPKTNPGATGLLPASTCGNNTVEGLESCDDNNTMSNDGCSAMCVTESCGDGVVQMSEQCDDTNSNEGDGCSTACVLPVVGDDIAPSADGDGGGCCQTGGPGAAPGLALLVLGLLLRRRRLS
jgi:MYXO-CTERM domain-containing protein